MAEDFFGEVTEPIRYEGLGSTEPLAYKVYDPDRLVLGTRMEDHLRPGVCFWHSFAWPGVDMFGLGTMDRPWLDGSADPMDAARTKMAAAFEFFTKIGIPFYCFHDRDVAPEGATFTEFRDNLDALTDDAAGYQERTGVRLLWGTANLFTHPRYQAGAATNPDPEVFAYAAAQVKHMLEVTLRLGGENYVLWGGREGYDTLLNTDLAREGAQLARFLHLVAEHKHRIGFGGQLLIEPKPMEPTKHQYDYDVSTVYGFLVRHGLEDEYRVNIEANHATLAGHSFHHEVAFRGRTDPRQHRRQPGRSAERLGHRPVPEFGRGSRVAAVRDPPGRWHRARRLQLRCQAAAPEHRSDRPVPRPHRRPRHARPGVARGGGPDRARRLAEMREAALRGLGRRAREGDPRRLRDAGIPRGEGRGGHDRPHAACRAARSCSRTSSTSRPGRPNRLETAGAEGGSRPRIDVSTTATKAVLVDETGAVAASGSAEYGFSAPGRCGASRTPQPGGTARWRRSARSWPKPGTTGADVVAVGLTGQMHGWVLLDAADRVLRPAILWNDQRTAAECDAIRAAVGPERLIADHRQRCADRVHRAQARLGPRPRAGGVGRVRHMSCCPRTTCDCG